MPDLAIDLKHVAKIYRGNVHALQGISMQVRRGEIFGLLGPNGAGKSTLVKIMMTVVRPTRAEGTVLGKPIGQKATLARVGYLPENHRFPRYLTGRQTLEFFAAMAKVDRATAKRRSDELLEVVGMSAWSEKKISTYSKGMLQRIGLAQAMANDPDLILLDEPTDGVDPIGRRDIREVLDRLRQQGKSIFINSHQLSELEMICDRVAIMVRGHVVQQGTVDELTRQQQRYEIELALPDPSLARVELLELLRRLGAAMQEKNPPPSPTTDASSPLPLSYVGGPTHIMAVPQTVPRYAIDTGKLPDGSWVELEGPVIRMGTVDPNAIQPFVDLFRSAGLTIRRLMPVRQTLEHLFMQAVVDPISGRELTPGGAGRTAAPVQFVPPIPSGARQP